jgi:hypothetical protein
METSRMANLYRGINGATSRGFFRQLGNKCFDGE